MTLEVSAVIGGRHTEPITFTPEQLDYVAQAGKALRRAVDPATGEVLAAAPDTRVSTPAGELPEALLDTFRQFYGAADKHQWDIGRVVDDAVIEFTGKLSANKIIKAAAKEMDVSRSQIVKCRDTWAMTDQALRDEFEMLTFEHFACLRVVGDRDKARKWLALAVDSAAEYGGRFMPAAKLAAKVREALGLLPPEPTFAQLVERALSAAEKVREHAPDARKLEIATQVCKLLDKIF